MSGPRYDGELALELLRRHWGHSAFRPGQEAIVRDAVEGRNVLAILPTGGGKSLCYQLPALMSGGLTLVVSPLVALMQDQVAALKARKIPAVHVNGSISHAERESAWNAAEHGAARLMFMSPETMQTEVFQARIGRLPVERIAIDEAHCISEWGHDFRPAYLQIPLALKDHAHLPVLALTATATARVRADIVSQLGYKDYESHVFGVDRPNIRWEVIRNPDLFGEAQRVISSTPGAGVIYAGTRANAASWARRLTDIGVECRPYHAGMGAAERRKVLQAWTAGTCRVVSATSAFGMGIDKADVRFVIHTMMPSTLEAYYQEAGRAGRDGLPARAVLITPDSDDQRVRTWSVQRYPSAKRLRKVYDVVCDLGSVAVGDEAEMSFGMSAERVAQITHQRVGEVRSAIDLIETMGLWRQVKPRHDAVWLTIQPHEAALRAAFESSTEPVRSLADALLRVQRKDASAGFDQVSQRALCAHAGLEPERLREGLRHFEERGLIGPWLDEDDALIAMVEPRSARPALRPDRVARLRRRASSQAEDMIVYASVGDCRRRVLLTYFGEAAPDRCGNCDNCLQ